MENIFKWIKEHKISVIIIIIGIFFLPIFVVHLLFKLPSICEFLSTEWSSGDVLSYISGFYALLGTIIFSMLTLYQNHVINKQNDQYNKTLKEKELKRDMPWFDIETVRYYGNYSKLNIKIKNISDNPANNIKILNLVVYNIHEDILYKSENVSIKNNAIEARSSIDINLPTPDFKESNLKICFDFECKDKFSNNHKIKVTGTTTGNEKMVEWNLLPID